MPAPSADFDIHEHYASFATTSRLIACLTSEAIVPVHFIPALHPVENFIGLCLLLSPNSSTVTLDSVLAVVPLCGLPILNMDICANWNGVACPRIDLIDSIDMLPHIYNIGVADRPSYHRDEIHQTLKTVLALEQEFKLIDGYDAVSLWGRLSKDLKVSSKLADQIAQELGSSMIFQKYIFDHPKPLPTLMSSTITWEQMSFEGHATHPMHKARKSFPPMKPLTPGSYDLDHPKIRLVAIPRESAVVRGNYEALSHSLVNALIKASGNNIQEIRSKYDNDYVYIFIHELQIPNVKEKFTDVVVFSEQFSLTVEALASLRSIALPDVLPNLSVKLCLGIKISSALRTVTPFTTYFGPGFSEIVPHLTYDQSVLAIERELGTITYRHEDTDVAKHCSSVIREAFEYDAEYKEDLFVPCCILVEKIQKPDTNDTLLTHVWKLNTQEKRINFLTRYVDLALRAFLPPCLENGVAFEAHGQNTLARFDRSTGELKGFVIRDFGGIKAHNETLKRSTGYELDVLPESCVVANSLEEVFKNLYHTLFHCHLQRLIRVLDLHYNGIGWQIVRDHMSELIPRDHVMWPMFMENEKVPGKCLIRMKIEELYRDYIYRPVPNMIQFKPQAIPKV